MHLDERYWPEPYAFKPERFDTRINPTVNNYMYAPFSLGPRMCIGNRFALVEATVFLAMLVRQFKFRLPEDFPTTLPVATYITLSPEIPVRIIVENVL